jgi:hypothetical protein
MHVVEIFLPTGGAGMEAELTKLRATLTDKFGGVTAFTRAPAHGAWRAPHTAHVQHDELIVIEIMTEAIDPAWWGQLREKLEAALKQEEILIRAHAAEQL